MKLGGAMDFLHSKRGAFALTPDNYSSPHHDPKFPITLQIYVAKHAVLHKKRVARI